MLQELAMKDILGSTAINPGNLHRIMRDPCYTELSWEHFGSSLPFLCPFICDNIKKFMCLYSSQVMPKTPSLVLKFAVNNSFVVHDPVFIIYGNQVGGFIFEFKLFLTAQLDQKKLY